MNRKALDRLQQSVRSLPQVPPPTAASDVDIGQLAREAAAAFADQLDRYRRTRDTESPLDPRERPPNFLLDAIRAKAPEEITFADLERLARVDPAASTARWAEVRAAAADDLDKGWHAARAMEPFGSSAWDRACFLAIRERLHGTWPPRHHGEALLLDQIAQYETLRQSWVTILAAQTRDPRTRLGSRPPGEGPGTAAIAAETARVVERLNRLIQGTIRTLLGLRRTPAALVVRRVEQLNVAAGPQMNVIETNDRNADAT